MNKNELLKTKLYFILAALLLTAVCIVVYTSMRSQQKQSAPVPDLAQEQTETAEDKAEDVQQVNGMQHPDTPAQSLPAAEGESTAGQEKPAETTYVLTVADGYLEVYIAQTGVHYMETEIAYELLPEQVQQQIDEGKYFESEEALLEFLENYSS